MSEGTECQGLKLEQLMYNHLAIGCQLAYTDYLIVLTSDLAHVMLVLKNTFTVLFTLIIRSLTTMTVDHNFL